MKTKIEAEPILTAEMHEYLTLCAEKLTALAELAATIDRGDATDDQRSEAADAAAFLLAGDKLGGCAELAGMLHSAVRPFTAADAYRQSGQAEREAAMRAEKAKEPVPPTYEEMCEKGIDRVGRPYGRR